MSVKAYPVKTFIRLFLTVLQQNGQNLKFTETVIGQREYLSRFSDTFRPYCGNCKENKKKKTRYFMHRKKEIVHQISSPT